MLLIVPEYYIMFRLKEHIVFAVASYSKIKLLFEMYLSFYVLLVSKELKYQKIFFLNFQRHFSYDFFYL